MRVKYLSTIELMARWQTTVDRSILDAIENGLQAYEEGPDVGMTGLLELDAAEVVDRYNHNGSGYTQPLNFQRLLFKSVDVEQFEAITNEAPLPMTAKERILKLVKTGPELSRGDFKPGRVPEIDEICKECNVTHETLRRYVADAKLLKPTKPGRPANS